MESSSDKMESSSDKMESEHSSILVLCEEEMSEPASYETILSQEDKLQLTSVVQKMCERFIGELKELHFEELGWETPNVKCFAEYQDDGARVSVILERSDDDNQKETQTVMKVSSFEDLSVLEQTFNSLLGEYSALGRHFLKNWAKLGFTVTVASILSK